MKYFVLTCVRLLRDVEFFKNRISKLDGAGDIGDFLLSIINEKLVGQGRNPSAGTPEPGGRAGEEARANGNGTQEKA